MTSKEALDNAKSSEAMKYVEGLITWFEYNFSKLGKEKNQEHIEQLNIVKQALTTNNYYKTAFELIKEYEVDVWLLKQCDYENYVRIRKNAMILNKQITEEEFDFLKESLENEKINSLEL